jgi:hypothetical protein
VARSRTEASPFLKDTIAVFELVIPQLREKAPVPVAVVSPAIQLSPTAAPVMVTEVVAVEVEEVRGPSAAGFQLAVPEMTALTGVPLFKVR